MTVIDVTQWDAAEDEPLGTKPKQWLRDTDNQLWLWKERTEQSDGSGGRFPKGDDWSAVRRVLQGVSSPTADPGMPDAYSWFVGYLLLDALGGNTDRHQDNWAVLRSASAHPRLAPSFDHASCLGFLLSDADRRERLTTKDELR